MNIPPKAALDIGTNSTRFLAIRSSESGFTRDSIVARNTVITRLGEGLDESGTLSNEAMERVLEQVKNYARRVEDIGGTWVGGAATSACRRASNGEEFLKRIENHIEVVPEVISGEREARLIFQGAYATLPDLSTGRIMDIGGGSTEWITFERSRYKSLESTEVGVVTLLERFGDRERWSTEAVSKARKFIQQQFPGHQGKGPLVVVGGTGTTLSAYNQGLSEYQPSAVHGQRLTLEDVQSMRRNLQEMSRDEISNVPTIQPGREDVILPGILILEEFASFAGRERVIVSDFGILAGLLEEATGE